MHRRGLYASERTGSCIRYDENFASVSYSGNKHFDNVEIDREKEIVKFHYAGELRNRFKNRYDDKGTVKKISTRYCVVFFIRERLVAEFVDKPFAFVLLREKQMDNF